MQHNIDAISFMISSFKEVTTSFGENNKSVDFFKNNVEGLARIGQISRDDIELVYKVLGCTNTNAIKWDITRNKLNTYVQAMNQILSYGKTDKSAINALIFSLKQNNTINQDMEQLLKETFGIKADTIKKDSGYKPNFGSSTYKKDSDNSVGYGRILRQVNILKQYSHLQLRVENPHAVCTTDTYYYKSKIQNLLNNKVIVSLLCNGAEFDIGEYKDTDPCHGGLVWHSCKIDESDEIHKINWKEFYKFCKNNNIHEL